MGLFTTTNTMPRILIAECIHEICSFNPVPTRYDDFFINVGPKMLAYHTGVGSEVGGALQVFSERPDLEVVPVYSARGITSGGTIFADDFSRLADEFLDTIRNAPPADGIYFALHGAMAATNECDPEGYLLEQTRKIVGETVPIVASFDLHGILTDRMLQHADAIVVYHTYPHIDFFQTGQRGARLLLRIMAGACKPVTAKVRIPALVRGNELITATGVFGQIIYRAKIYEESPSVLSAGMFIGNPFTDVQDLACYSVVVTDNDAPMAEQRARRLADVFWDHRTEMQAKLTGLDESVRLATETEGTAILVDAADATSSGAPGDSNAILNKLLEKNYRGKALIPIVDAPAVEAAFAVGIGARVTVRLGGTLDKRFTPIEITAQVRMLSDGRFRSESFQQEWYSGQTVVLQADNITLVVTSRPVHLYDRSLFYAHGQNPRHFDLVVVKSPHCQPHMFADWCGRLINVDAPGATSASVRSLGHTQCRRPLFPLDENVEFVPEVKVFAR